DARIGAELHAHGAARLECAWRNRTVGDRRTGRARERIIVGAGRRQIRRGNTGEDVEPLFVSQSAADDIPGVTARIGYAGRDGSARPALPAENAADGGARPGETAAERSLFFDDRGVAEKIHAGSAAVGDIDKEILQREAARRVGQIRRAGDLRVRAPYGAVTEAWIRACIGERI